VVPLNRRKDCCDSCAKEWDCPLLVDRCLKAKGGSCESCLPCDSFESKFTGPFIKALDLIEGVRH